MQESVVGWGGRVEWLSGRLITQHDEQVAFKYQLLPLSRHIDSINIC